MFRNFRVSVVLIALVAIVVLSACGGVESDDSLPVVVNTITAKLPTVNTPVPTVTQYPTQTPAAFETQHSYGFYRDCNSDPADPENCLCVDYNFTIDMTRQNCGEYLCETVINFTSEYGDGTTMWIDYFDTQTSRTVQSGETILLADLDSSSWGIGPRPFFENTPTPQP
ncbi:MAG: hypothetical protein WC503_05915 [Candidatus Shapirobacteria bacterium]